ncbi:MAG: DUF433 domain-containing protein [Candidatus Altiarchaeota archaeon]
MKESLRKKIVVDPKIMVGKPVIKGTRIPVDAIIKRMADGLTIEEILVDYPKLVRDDIKAALQYSIDVLRGEDVVPLVIKGGKHAAPSR